MNPMNSSSSHVFSRRARGLFTVALCFFIPYLAFPPARARAQASSPLDPVFELQSVKGERARGSLVWISHDKIALETIAKAEEPGKKRTLVEMPLIDVVKLSRVDLSAPLPPEGSQVLFPGGDRLRAAVNGATDAALETRSRLLGNVSIPIDSFLGLVLVPPIDSKNMFPLAREMRSQPKGAEVFWLSNGDRLKGSFMGLDAAKLTIRTEGKESELDRMSVTAMAIDPGIVNYPIPNGHYLEVGLADGSRLGLVQTSVEKGVLRGIARFKTRIEVPVSDVAFIRVLGGNVSYLSDAPPDDVVYVSYVGPVLPYQLDATCENRPMIVRDKTYDRGVGAQTHTLLAYKLGRGYARFQATVAVDDSAGRLGNVVFRVLADSKVKFASAKLSARDTPIDVDVDVAVLEC